MKVVYSDDHRLHAGGRELLNGELVLLFETPERLDRILEQLIARGFGELLAPEPHDLAPILRVHDPDYVAFLREAHALWRAEEPSAPDCALPFAFAQGAAPRGPGRSVHAKLGRYCFDLSVPFVAGTWQAAKSACDVALTALALVKSGERAAFALCRPPGHHAGRALAGGYCYLNNAAVAAQAALDAGAARVALLDVDYHHGNGSQAIFYDRAELLFVSLHGHPDQEYPYFSGFAEEAGSGPGEGFTLNLPLPWGTAWPDYADALERGLARIRDYGPDLLLVSLGVDSFKDDPISHFRLEHDDFRRIGAAVAGLGRPALFVMEGGYAVADIGVNVVNCLSGFAEAA